MCHRRLQETSKRDLHVLKHVQFQMIALNVQIVSCEDLSLKFQLTNKRCFYTFWDDNVKEKGHQWMCDAEMAASIT